MGPKTYEFKGFIFQSKKLANTDFEKQILDSCWNSNWISISLKFIGCQKSKKKKKKSHVSSHDRYNKYRQKNQVLLQWSKTHSCVLLESWQNPVVEVVVKNLGKKLRENSRLKIQGQGLCIISFCIPRAQQST